MQEEGVVRGMDAEGSVQRKCLGENDGWCGICWKVCVRVSVCVM